MLDSMGSVQSLLSSPEIIILVRQRNYKLVMSDTGKKISNLMYYLFILLLLVSYVFAVLWLAIKPIFLPNCYLIIKVVP